MIFLWDGEGVEDAVTFGHSEDHFGELVDISGIDDSRNIHQSELLDAILIKLWILWVNFIEMEHFSGLEQEIFVVFQLIYFRVKICNRTVSFLQLVILGVHCI